METKRAGWVIGVVVCACFIFMCSISAYATSVYTIGHGTGPWATECPFNAFEVVNDQIVFRGSVGLPVHGYGGIAVAYDELTNTLFVSFENGEYGGGNIIEIVDAGTLQNTARTINGVTDLTSIVFDTETRKLYGTDRNTNLLHVIGWNPAQKTVSLEKTIELENIDDACGLAIADDLLYVSELIYSTSGNMTYYSDVNCYRISEDFAFVETIDMGDKTVAIAHEADGNNLYGGAYAYTTYQHLIKNDLDDPNDLIKKNIGAGVIGVACDNSTTGRIFLTTYRNGGSVEMWDTADWVVEPNTLTADDATDIFDDPSQQEADVRNLSGILVVDTPKPPQIQIVKRDDVETCVSPTAADPNFVYTIGISDPNGHENLWIVDYLPREVDFVSASPADPNNGYDLESHTYTWFVPSIDSYDPNDPNSIPGGDPNEYFTLTVRPNGWAEPKSSFTNIVTVESDTAYNWAATETNVCCWGGDVIYVDKRAVEDTGYVEFMGMESTWAAGRNTGTSWEDAYRNLSDALARADECGSEVWVAGGTYRPADTVLVDTFEIPAGVSVYGGFAGDETSRDQRDIIKNKTTLYGFIALVPDGFGGYYETLNNIVVTMNGNGALLDGFTVEKGRDYGIDGSGFSSTIANCVIENNEETGVYCLNGNLTVKWCKIKENGQQGIYHRGSGYSLTVENCKIHDNQYDGILTDSSTSTILNSLIYQNGSNGAYYAIHIGNPSSSPTIRNNTIVQNVNEGIRFVGNYTPDIVNCIVYYNGGDAPLAGLNPDAVAEYSCIQDCNELGTTNINDEPGFAYTTEPNNLPVVGNYHLAYNSPCVDTGDSDEYTDELDADGEPRVDGTWVDRGADEAYSCDDEYLTEDDIFNPLDWNADGLVNFNEFSRLAATWLIEDPNALFDPDYDFNDDDVVNLADLQTFCASHWLWTACWNQSLYDMYGTYGMMSMGGESMLVLDEAEAMMTAPMISTATLEPETVTEKSIAEQLLTLKECVEFLEKIWMEDDLIQQEIDPDDWERFMDSVYNSAVELKTQLDQLK